MVNPQNLGSFVSIEVRWPISIRFGDEYDYCDTVSKKSYENIV